MRHWTKLQHLTFLVVLPKVLELNTNFNFLAHFMNVCAVSWKGTVPADRKSWHRVDDEKLEKNYIFSFHSSAQIKGFLFKTFSLRQFTQFFMSSGNVIYLIRKDCRWNVIFKKIAKHSLITWLKSRRFLRLVLDKSRAKVRMLQEVQLSIAFNTKHYFYEWILISHM